MREPPASSSTRTTPAAPSPGAPPARSDPLEDLVAELLEAAPAERGDRLARLEREDPGRARRLRSRLGALGELGLAVDHAPRALRDLPERFGEYRRLERVGAGGMGEVHLAVHEPSGGLAALKLVRLEHLWFENARERFRREVLASTQLSHEGVVRVLAVGEEHGLPWLAMEWVGGASLELVLERLRGVPPEALSARDFSDAVRAASVAHGRAEPARDDAFPGRTYAEVVARVLARVARALSHAHEFGVLHRDVKPSNVLVTPAGRVLLADFGLALPRGADRMTRTGSWLGSLPYAAPEQIEGSPRELDHRADVYSLCATFYELLTLRTPFLGGPETAVRRRIATGDLEAPRRVHPALPAAFERICLAGLDPDRERRTQHADDVARDLESALAGGPVRARPAPAWLRAKRWARCHPSRASAIAAVALVVLASVGFGLRERSLTSQLVRLADLELVRGLEQESRGFWPAAERHLAPIDAWLARARTLLARRAEHQAALDELVRRSLPASAEELAAAEAPVRAELAVLAHELDALAGFLARGRGASAEAARTNTELDLELGHLTPAALLASVRGRLANLRVVFVEHPESTPNDLQQISDFERIVDKCERQLALRTQVRFEEALDGWRYESLVRLLADFEALGELAERVRAQREATARLVRLAADSAPLWISARETIAASPLYGGLSIEPIFGLVPLGLDPRTGCFEFLHAQSGSMPERDPVSGWRIGEESGLVLVLLPGGRFTMGQRPGEGSPRPNLQPHEVELAPFLFSRFEMTVAQAERLGGFPEERPRTPERRLPLVLDWERARRLMLRSSLELPTEAQWEYAARRGCSDPSTIEGRSNFRDASAMRWASSEGIALDILPEGDFDDGFPRLAPVGSFAADAIGFFDLFGNVSEWCLDSYVSRGYSTLAPRAGDGLRATVVSAQLRSHRGGSCTDVESVARPWVRMCEAPAKFPHSIGIRPARSLSPD